MRYRRVLAEVRWAFRESVVETELDLKKKEYKRLCDHCQVIDGPNCPRKRQLQKQHKNMIAVKCEFFHPLDS